MIINISRANQFLQCRKKALYWDIRRLGPQREADPLIEGGAYHKGCAVLVATKDRKQAKQAAETSIRERKEKILKEGHIFLPEEQTLIEQQIELVGRLVDAQADQYEKDNWQVLMPEVTFLVPLPSTEHHCAFVHNILHPDNTDPDDHDHCNDFSCAQPIWFNGTTDAVLSWDKLIWLLERKTSSDPRQQYWDQWALDNQPVGYIYGIWKSTKIRPNGFIIERVLKPRKNAANPFHVSLEREPFLVSDERLQTFEHEITQIAQDYEEAFIRNRWYMNPKACLDYNRRCYYWDLCKRNGQEADGEFVERQPDYVEENYLEIIKRKESPQIAHTP